MPKKGPHDDVLRSLRAFGLAYPGAHTKSPWPGHLDLAVADKTFAYLSLEGEPLRASCKLPESSAAALMLPFVEPTGYGLGKSGWVTATFPEDATPPLPVLQEWIDESYRAQAPKRLVKELDARSSVNASVAAPSRASSAPKKAPSPRSEKTPAKGRSRAAAETPEATTATRASAKTRGEGRSRTSAKAPAAPPATRASATSPSSPKKAARAKPKSTTKTTSTTPGARSKTKRAR